MPYSDNFKPKRCARPECSAIFTPHSGAARYCSPECRRKTNREIYKRHYYKDVEAMRGKERAKNRKRRNSFSPRPCRWCGTTFYGKSNGGVQHYCSKSCAREAKNKEQRDKFPQQKEQKRLYVQQWRENNREKAREYVRQRRARVGDDGYRRHGPALLAEFGPICQICQQPLEQDEQGSWVYWIDHIRPVSKGGTDDYTNLQLSHASCNIRKQDKWDGTGPDEPPAQLSLFD